MAKKDAQNILEPLPPAGQLITGSRGSEYLVLAPGRAWYLENGAQVRELEHFTTAMIEWPSSRSQRSKMCVFVALTGLNGAAGSMLLR